MRVRFAAIVSKTRILLTTLFSPTPSGNEGNGSYMSCKYRRVVTTHFSMSLYVTVALIFSPSVLCLRHLQTRERDTKEWRERGRQLVHPLRSEENRAVAAYAVGSVSCGKLHCDNFRQSVSWHCHLFASTPSVVFFSFVRHKVSKRIRGGGGSLPPLDIVGHFG